MHGLPTIECAESTVNNPHFTGKSPFLRAFQPHNPYTRPVIRLTLKA